MEKQGVIHFFFYVEELPKQKQQPFRVWICVSWKSVPDLPEQWISSQRKCQLLAQCSFELPPAPEENKFTQDATGSCSCDWQLWGIVDGLSPSFEHIFWPYLNFLLISPALCLPTGEYACGCVNSTMGYKWIKGNLFAEESLCSTTNTASALLRDLSFRNHRIILTEQKKGKYSACLLCVF